MKNRPALLAASVLIAAFLFLNQAVEASPNAKVTLNAGEAVVVTANQCTLHVLTNTISLVRVKCTASALDTRTPVGIGLSKVTLNAGNVVKIFAQDCQLKVVKNEAATVKVTCKPNPPDASVTVAPNGTLTYSGDVSIHVGQTVEWTWASSDHTVTSGNGTPDNLFCSPTDTNCTVSNPSSAGAKYRHTFTTVGSFQYYCHVHGIQMTATVNVSP